MFDPWRSGCSGGFPCQILFVPLLKGTNRISAIVHPHWCAARLFSNLLFEDLSSKTEEASVDSFRRGRIKLLTGLIQGDNDLDLMENIPSAIGRLSTCLV